MGKDESKSPSQWLSEHYRPTIYGLIIIVAMIPYLSPLGLPIQITSESQAFYNAINNLKDGNTVLVIYNWSSGNWGELGGAAITLSQQLALKHVKVVYVSMGVEGPLLVERVTTSQKGGVANSGKYGTDWVNLGFAPGGEQMLAAIMASPDGFYKTFGQKDYYGTSFSSLPIMKNVLDNKSIDFTAVVTSSGVINVVRQLYTPYKIPIVSACIGSDWPEIKLFINTGQVMGGLQSLRGSAEYEKITGFLGIATSSIEALSLNHLLLIGLLVVGNFIYLYYGRGANARGKGD